MTDLLKSRQFWVAVVGAIVTLTGYFIAKYAFAALEDFQTVINVLMPIILALIAVYTIESAVVIISQAQVDINTANLNAQMQMHMETLNAQAITANRKPSNL